jgi:hypothetical protein
MRQKFRVAAPYFGVGWWWLFGVGGVGLYARRRGPLGSPSGDGVQTGKPPPFP